MSAAYSRSGGSCENSTRRLSWRTRSTLCGQVTVERACDSPRAAARVGESPILFLKARSNMKIQGIIPPVATPMQANEDLDLPRLKSFIDHLIQEGVHGIFVLGTNSEF